MPHPNPTHTVENKEKLNITSPVSTLELVDSLLSPWIIEEEDMNVRPRYKGGLIDYDIELGLSTIRFFSQQRRQKSTLEDEYAITVKPMK